MTCGCGPRGGCVCVGGVSRVVFTSERRECSVSCILPTMSLGLGGLLNLETVDGLLSYVFFYFTQFRV